MYEYTKKLLHEKGLADEIGLVRTTCFKMYDLGQNVMVFPEGECYSQMTKEKALEIVETLAKQPKIN